MMTASPVHSAGTRLPEPARAGPVDCQILDERSETMSQTAEKTDPKLWDKVKTRVTRSSKGGKPGQWSARKAQMATQEYKKEGGEYAGKKSDDNHLKQWTDEKWGTKSGKESGKTGERY